MDRETQVTAPPVWLKPEALHAFLDDLRSAHYNIGTEEYLSAHDLVLALAARGEPLDDPAAFRGLLGPLVCNSPQEQDDFRERYGRWLERLGVSPPPVIQIAQGGKEREEAEEELAKTSRLASLRVRIFVGVACCAVVAVLALWGGFRTSIGSGGVPGGTVSTDPNALPIDSGRIAVFTVAALAVVAAGLLWRKLWRRQARLFLEKHGTDSEPELDRVPVKGVAVADPMALFRTAQLLRRRYEEPSGLLDVEPTIKKSAEAGGWFTPVYGKRLVTPEYLVLVDRRGRADQQADLTNHILQAITGEGVHIASYGFDGDPRICVAMDGKREAVALTDLASRFPGRRLIVFSDGTEFVDPVTGKLKTWTEILGRWRWRTLLTTEAKVWWGRREGELGRVFEVVPAELHGIERAGAATRRHASLFADTSQSGAPSPEMVSPSDRTWLAPHPPDSSAIADMVGSLRRFLDEDVFYWLSACAVYPAMSLDLTLFLGESLTGANGNKLFDSNRLNQLLRLPWFRYGSMPDWLRALLVSQLPAERAAQVREALNALLLSAAKPGTDARFYLEIAREGRGSVGSLAKGVFQRFYSEAKPTSQIRDYVFARLMSGKKITQLAPRVPRAVEEIFGHGAVPLQGASRLLRVYQVLSALALLTLLGGAALMGESGLVLGTTFGIGLAIVFAIVAFVTADSELMLLNLIDISLPNVLIGFLEAKVEMEPLVLLGSLPMLIVRWPAVTDWLCRRIQGTRSALQPVWHLRLASIVSAIAFTTTWLNVSRGTTNGRTFGFELCFLPIIGGVIACVGFRRGAGRWPHLAASICCGSVAWYAAVIQMIKWSDYSAPSQVPLAIGLMIVSLLVHAVAIIAPRAWPLRLTQTPRIDLSPPARLSDQPWRSRALGGLIGAASGGVIAVLMMQIQTGSSINWRAFDWGDPRVHLGVAFAIAGIVSGLDRSRWKWTSIGAALGWLAFTAFETFYFIVEEGIVLLEIGAILGAVLAGRSERRKKQRSAHKPTLA